MDATERNATEQRLFEQLKRQVASPAVPSIVPAPTELSGRLEAASGILRNALRQDQVPDEWDSEWGQLLFAFLKDAKFKAPGSDRADTFKNMLKESTTGAADRGYGLAVPLADLDVKHLATCLCLCWNLYPVGRSTNLCKEDKKLCASMNAGAVNVCIVHSGYITDCSAAIKIAC
jgi:hypothetical protein